MSSSPCFSHNACVELGKTRFVSSSMARSARRTPWDCPPPRRRETRAHMDRPEYLEYGAAGSVEQHLARLRTAAVRAGFKFPPEEPDSD